MMNELKPKDSSLDVIFYFFLFSITTLWMIINIGFNLKPSLIEIFIFDCIWIFSLLKILLMIDIP